MIPPPLPLLTPLLLPLPLVAMSVTSPEPLFRDPPPELLRLCALEELLLLLLLLLLLVRGRLLQPLHRSPRVPAIGMQKAVTFPLLQGTDPFLPTKGSSAQQVPG